MSNKKIWLLCALAACVLALTGCSLFSGTEVSTVELQNKGGIKETTIEDFPASEYDAEDFTSYVNDAVEEYSEDGEGSVKVRKNKTDGDVITLIMEYDGAAAYSDFNNVECFSGNVSEAAAAGYDFSVDFFAAGENSSDDSLSDETGEQPAVSGNKVTSDGSLSVFIVRTSANVRVPGTVKYYYVDAGSAAVPEKDTVAVTPDAGGNAAGSLVYVLYQ